MLLGELAFLLKSLIVLSLTALSSSFNDLVDVQSSNPIRVSDSMESFVLAETLKYYYLLVSWLLNYQA